MNVTSYANLIQALGIITSSWPGEEEEGHSCLFASVGELKLTHPSNRLHSYVETTNCICIMETH
jgi:hypothetical protein